MSQRLTGKVRISKGRFHRLLVALDDGRTVEVAPRQGQPVFPGDTVRVEVDTPKWARFRRRRRGRDPIEQASVVEVLKRGRPTMVGRYRSSRNRGWLVPDAGDVIAPLEVEHRSDLPDGTVVAVELGDKPGVIKGKIAAVWTDPEAPRAVIERVIYDRGLPIAFPPEVEREAAEIGEDIDREERRRRTDLRELEVVVIDPADAKDHDDAVSIEPGRSGGWRIGVHIADVSHYVRPGTAIDREASARGVSCYLPDRVIPMLPFRLSADVCSLIEGKDRLARSVFLDYASDGTFQGGEMVESVVRPTVSLSYDEVQAVLDGGVRHPREEPLRALHRAARRLREIRFAGGSLDFQFPETRVVLDENGEATGITQRRSDAAHWLIEELMIEANRFVGERLTRSGAGIWRIHEPPGMDDVAELEEFLKGLGVKLRRGTRGADLHPKDFQHLLERFKGTPEEYIVQRKVLQAMRMAVYGERNTGHFGLAIDNYAHFTSPIRRYADLVVHRLTKPGRGKTGGAGRPPPRRLGELAAHISERERAAQEAEWFCTKAMILRYLDRQADRTWEGTISRVERFGFFVELDGAGIDGLVRLEDLGGERYFRSRDETSLRGRRSGRAFRIGHRVSVRIARIDKDAGHLDLVLAETP